MVQHALLAAPKFAAWNVAALRALTATTPSSIAEALDGALRLVLDFDIVLIAALHRDAPPGAPYYGGAQEPSPAYHDGPYLLDPFYNHFLAGTTEGCFRLSESSRPKVSCAAITSPVITAISRSATSLAC